MVDPRREKELDRRRLEELDRIRLENLQVIEFERGENRRKQYKRTNCVRTRTSPASTGRWVG